MRSLYYFLFIFLIFIFFHPLLLFLAAAWLTFTLFFFHFCFPLFSRVLFSCFVWPEGGEGGPAAAAFWSCWNGFTCLKCHALFKGKLSVVLFTNIANFSPHSPFPPFLSFFCIFFRCFLLQPSESCCSPGTLADPLQQIPPALSLGHPFGLSAWRKKTSSRWNVALGV